MSFKEQARWSKPRIESERRALADELTELVSREGETAVTGYLHRGMAALEADLAPEAQLRRFLLLLALVGQHENDGSLSSGDLARLRDLGEAILKTQGIYAGSSRLSYLYGDLLLSFARIRHKEGRHWTFAWQTQMAQFLSKGEAGDTGSHALETAEAALRRGNLTTAIEALTVAETLGLEALHEFERARLGRVKALRLTGRPDEAAGLHAETKLSRTVSPATNLALDWEGICRELQKTGDMARMIQATGRTGDHREALYILEATLWAKAVTSKQWLTRLPKAESIRKAFSDSLKKPSANALLYECVLQLERCYDNDIPLLKRLADLGDMLERVPKLYHIDHELLVWAASARWLIRYHQQAMADFAVAEYRALSLRMTDGTLADCLGVVADLEIKAWSKLEDRVKSVVVGEQQTLQRIKTSRLSRAAEMTKLAAQVGGVVLKGKIKGIGQSEAGKERIAFEQQSEIIAAAVASIGRLKGPLVKIGQMMGFFLPSLPEDLARALGTLRDGVAPLDSSVIRAQVEKEFGMKVEDLFASWDDQPLAAASIGQLHLARLKSGREVVVKVQYPGIRDVITSDFGLLRMLKPLYRMYFPNANIDEVLAESVEKLLDECDYVKEAANQTAARRMHTDDPAILIPEVIHELTGKTVITMDYVRGAHFGEFVMMATQEERNKAASTIYRFGWTSFLRHGFLHGDPHPGNFLFLNDGRVAFLDFGYAGNYAEHRLPLWKALFRAVLEKDFDGFKATLVQMELMVEGMPFDFESAFETANGSLAAIRSDVPFTFSRTRIMENVEKVTIKSANRNAARLPKDDGMYLRFAWCLQNVMGEMGAEFQWSSIMRPLLYETSEAKAKAPGRSA